MPWDRRFGVPIALSDGADERSSALSNSGEIAMAVAPIDAAADRASIVEVEE
jgi:hypothetical protein